MKGSIKCSCGCGATLKDSFLGVLEYIDKCMVTDGVGEISINSGARCRTRNAQVGGVKGSSHLLGIAADIDITDGEQRMKLLGILADLKWKRCGIAKTFVHIDADKDKPHSWWVY